MQWREVIWKKKQQARVATSTGDHLTGKQRLNSEVEDGWRSGVYAERRENPVKGSERTESERVERNRDKGNSGGTLRHVVYPSAAELV